MKKIALAALSALAMSAQSQPLQRKDIEQAINHLEQAWNAGDAPSAAAVFGDDAQIVGEGSPAAVHGRAAIDKAVGALVAGSRAIRIDLRQYLATGPDSAATWVLWNVTPRDAKEAPFTVRSLFVWTREADGLRLRGDSYTVGAY